MGGAKVAKIKSKIPNIDIGSKIQKIKSKIPNVDIGAKVQKIKRKFSRKSSKKGGQTQNPNTSRLLSLLNNGPLLKFVYSEKARKILRKSELYSTRAVIMKIKFFC